MEHHHHTEPPSGKGNGDRSKTDLKIMHHGAAPSMGDSGHDHHAMMIADFRKRFYVVLVLTVPIMLFSTMIQHFIGIHWQFAGSEYILLAIIHHSCFFMEAGPF